MVASAAAALQGYCAAAVAQQEASSITSGALAASAWQGSGESSAQGFMALQRWQVRSLSFMQASVVSARGVLSLSGFFVLVFFLGSWHPPNPRQCLR